jgi:hypothetical protein
MITVRARFDGHVFIPESPVDLPAGAELELTITAPPPPPRPLAELADLVGRVEENPDWPPDGAAQHDHYLYGTPKRS